MLTDSFDQTTDTVYEVWNWKLGSDPLVGVFPSEAKADEFEMDQIIETGGGRILYYLPIERHSDLDEEPRAQALLTEVIGLLERISEELGYDPVLDTETLDQLSTDSPDGDVDVEYDQDSFRTQIDSPAMNDVALEIARAARTLARIRHLSVFNDRVLLTKEIELRELLSEVNENAME